MEADLESPQQIGIDAGPSAEPPSRKLAVFGFAGLLVVFLASLVLRLPPGDYFTICGFKSLTNLPCPGCGLTHSFCALGKGDVADAFALSGYFLERRLFDQKGEGLPEARRRLIERLGFAGRL